MKNRQIKKLGNNIIKLFFLSFAIAFFIKSQYMLAFLTLGLFFLTLRINDLSEFILSIKDGFQAKYRIPEEKIKEDIKENKRVLNKKSFINFKQIEERVLRDIQKRIGGEMKKQIHFVYKNSSKFEFTYTPDAVIQTDKELIFIEIKYVSTPNLIKPIVQKTIKQLETVLDKFSPSADKKLVIKFILACDFDIDPKEYVNTKGVELEFFKL